MITDKRTPYRVIDDGQLQKSKKRGNARFREKTIKSEHCAAVIAEPAMTNFGRVLPAEGYLEKLRELCTKHLGASHVAELAVSFNSCRRYHRMAPKPRTTSTGS